MKPKRIAITGAAHGLGKALAKNLALNGHSLYLADVDEAALFEISNRFENTHTTVVDVSDPDQMEKWANEIYLNGGCDVLINNAGVTVTALFEEHRLEDWNKLIGINLMGTVHGCHFFLPLLKETGGQIINISSIFGIVSMPTQAAYSATKYAVRGLSECLWEEMADSNVAVTVVHPGGIATKIIQHARSSSPLLREHLNDFFTHHAMAPEKAAKIIISSIHTRPKRVMLGSEAILFDRIKRLFPVIGNRWVSKQIRKKLKLDALENDLQDERER